MQQGAHGSTGGGGRRCSAGPAPAAEDRVITVFSPEGRLYQIDYAWSAVRRAGVTSIGVRGADSACVVGQRKLPREKLLDAASVSRLFPITERIGLLTTGIAGDGRSLVHDARNQTAEFRFTWGYEMPPDVLAKWIADRAQIGTQHIKSRPSGVVAMILGIDEEKEIPQLFTCDPAGCCLGHKAVSVGLNDDEAINFLEKKMSDNPALSFQATIEMAISALQHTLKVELKATEIEVGVVRKDDPAFRVLTAAEIEEHLKAINERNRS